MQNTIIFSPISINWEFQVNKSIYYFTKRLITLCKYYESTGNNFIGSFLWYKYNIKIEKPEGGSIETHEPQLL